MASHDFADRFSRGVTSLFDSYTGYRASWSHAGAVTGWPASDPNAGLAYTGPVVVRTYKAKGIEAASAMLAAEAPSAYAAGYTIAAQSWAPGSWGAGAFLLALLLILAAGFGLLVLAYLVVVKPAGTLTVTFSKS